VAPIQGFDAMILAGVESWWAVGQILIMHVPAPAVLTLAISEGFRKAGIIKNGDLKLSL